MKEQIESKEDAVIIFFISKVRRSAHYIIHRKQVNDVTLMPGKRILFIDMDMTNSFN